MTSIYIMCVASLTGALIGCAPLTQLDPLNATPLQARAANSAGAPLFGRFVGVLPCADCSGIHIDLRLYAEQPSARPTRYESIETYLGTRDGDRTIKHAGRWTIMR